MFESEERQIADKIKDFIKDKKPPEFIYIMLRNGNILNISNYYDMIVAGKVNPQDAYVFTGTSLARFKSAFYYTFLAWYDDLLNAYLSKLGFYYEFFAVPATGLKYIVDAEVYGRYLSIEVSSLDTVVNNTNLRKIVAEVLGEKLVSREKVLTREEYEKISDIYKSQQLFAGHNPNEAWRIIFKYYNEGNKSLIKEVARIAMDYDRIFQPYKVCYNMEKWKEVDCWSINLD